jgi:Na+-driven multidrug efflux pump
MSMGVKGAAQAHNITAAVTMVLLLTYTSFLKPIAKAWYWPKMRTFLNLKEFLMLALPGILMLLLENTNMQIMVLLSGLFGSEDAIAA